jgi:hypothetical protein
MKSLSSSVVLYSTLQISLVGEPAVRGTCFFADFSAIIGPDTALKLITSYQICKSSSAAKQARVVFRMKGKSEIRDRVLVELDPDTFFFNDEALDYAVVNVKVDKELTRLLTGRTIEALSLNIKDAELARLLTNDTGEALSLHDEALLLQKLLIFDFPEGYVVDMSKLITVVIIISFTLLYF